MTGKGGVWIDHREAIVVAFDGGAERPFHMPSHVVKHLSRGGDSPLQAPLARIADDVGYQTDTAFSRAFRREFGALPAAWRRSKSRQEGARGGGPSL
jgi:AraC-like DNA-binding protein